MESYYLKCGDPTHCLYRLPYSHKCIVRDMTHSSQQPLNSHPIKKMSNPLVTIIASLSMSDQQEISSTTLQLQILHVHVYSCIQVRVLLRQKRGGIISDCVYVMIISSKAKETYVIML